MRLEWPLLVLFSVLLDALTTSTGLLLGMGEAGPVASRILYALGPGYWLLEAGALLGLYTILRKAGLPPAWAAAVAVVGPWAAGWRNLGLIAGVVLGG